MIQKRRDQRPEIGDPLGGPKHSKIPAKRSKASINGLDAIKVLMEMGPLDKLEVDGEIDGTPWVLSWGKCGKHLGKSNILLEVCRYKVGKTG